MKMKSKKKRTVPKNALYKNVVNLWEAIPRMEDAPSGLQPDLPPIKPEHPQSNPEG